MLVSDCGVGAFAESFQSIPATAAQSPLPWLKESTWQVTRCSKGTLRLEGAVFAIIDKLTLALAQNVPGCSWN